MSLLAPCVQRAVLLDRAVSSLGHPILWPFKDNQNQGTHRALVILMHYTGKFALLDLHTTGSSSIQSPLLYTIWASWWLSG